MKKRGLAAAALVAGTMLVPTSAQAGWMPLVVSHRGYTGAGATENTVNSINEAAGRGADVIEIDVRFTKSNYPVIMHDATVDRTTTGTGYVRDKWVSQVVALTTNDGTRPPTLAEALVAIKNAGKRALVELKDDPTETQMNNFDEKVAVSGLSRDRIVVQSFISSAVWTARRHGYRMGRILTYATTADWAKKYDVEAAPYAKLTAAGVAEMHGAGVEIYAWTVNDPTWWPKLQDMEVDQIVTDADPATVKAALNG